MRDSPPAHAEYRPAAGEDVEHDHLLGHPERIVPRQDDSGGAELHPFCAPGDVRQQHDVVRAHSVAVEVVLNRPQAVVTQLLGEVGNLDFTGVHLLVSQRLVQVAEPEVNSDVRHGRSFTAHGPSRHCPLLGTPPRR
jgi:hypothetical protein